MGITQPAVINNPPEPYFLNHAESLFLDGLRGLAAQLVLIGHALDFFLTAIPEWLETYRLQEFGVVIFFVLSGYLIAYSCDRKQSWSTGKFSDYLRSRAVRIYSTLIPALLLIALLDVFFTGTFAQDFPIDYSPGTALINLLHLQEYPATHWPFFGSGYPLWSLSVEWWLYMGFGVCVFRDAWRHWYSYPLLLLAIGSLLYNSTSGNAPGLVLIWLLGAIGYWLGKPGKRASSTTLILIAAITAVGIGWEFSAPKTTSVAYHPLAMLVTLVLVLVSLHWFRSSPTASINRFIVRVIEVAANSSFSLYLLHFSILAALYPLYGKLADGYLILLALAIANLVAVICASWFEWHWSPNRGFYHGGRRTATIFRHND